MPRLPTIILLAHYGDDDVNARRAYNAWARTTASLAADPPYDLLYAVDTL